MIYENQLFMRIKKKILLYYIIMCGCNKIYNLQIRKKLNMNMKPIEQIQQNIVFVQNKRPQHISILIKNRNEQRQQKIN